MKKIINISNTESRILKLLKRSSSNQTSEQISDELGILTSVTKDCLTRLIEFGYIKHLQLLETYLLTTKGRLYLEDKRHSLIEKFLWSIVIPLVTSVIGTLITQYLIK